MALVKLSTPPVQWSGTIGGVYASRDDSGNHICSNMRKIKRRSTSQSKVRNAFLQVMQRWRITSANPVLVNAWSVFADYPETAFNAFVRISWYYAFNGLKVPGFPPP